MTHPLALALASRERSAAWLARWCRVSPAYVSRVVSGERRPAPQFRWRAALVLNLPEEELFPEESPPIVDNSS